MRNLERSGQWLTAVLIAIFALPILAVFVGMASGGHFWSQFLPMAGFLIILSMLRGPMERLGRAFRSLIWVCIGLAVGVVIAFNRGEPFNLTMAAATGLALAFGDFLSDYFRMRREARDG